MMPEKPSPDYLVGRPRQSLLDVISSKVKTIFFFVRSLMQEPFLLDKKCQLLSNSSIKSNKKTIKKCP